MGLQRFKARIAEAVVGGLPSDAQSGNDVRGRSVLELLVEPASRSDDNFRTVGQDSTTSNELGGSLEDFTARLRKPAWNGHCTSGLVRRGSNACVPRSCAGYACIHVLAQQRFPSSARH